MSENLGKPKVELTKPYKNNCVNKAFLQFFLYSFCSLGSSSKGSKSQKQASKFVSLNQNLGLPKNCFASKEEGCFSSWRYEGALPSALRSKSMIEKHSNTPEHVIKEPSYLIAQIVSSFRLCQPSTSGWLFQAFLSHDSKKDSLKSFFPYRKAFLSYWLCPFVGFMYTLQSFNGLNLNSSLQNLNERGNLNNSVSNSFLNLFEDKELDTLTKKQKILTMYPIPLNKDLIQLNSKEVKDLPFIATGASSFDGPYKSIRWNRLPIKYSQNIQPRLNNESLNPSNSKMGFENLTVNNINNINNNISEPFMLKMSLFNKSLNNVLDNSYNSENPKTSFKKAAFLLDNFVKQNLLFIAKDGENEKPSQKLTNTQKPFLGRLSEEIHDTKYISMRSSPSVGKEEKLSKKNMYRLLSTALKTSLSRTGNNNFSFMTNKKELLINENLTKTVNNKIVSILFSDLKIPVMNELGILTKTQKDKKYFKNFSDVSHFVPENIYICSNYSLPVLLNLKASQKASLNTLLEGPTNVEDKAFKDTLINKETVKKEYFKTNILKYSHPLFMSVLPSVPLKNLEIKNIFKGMYLATNEGNKVGLMDNLKIKKEIQLKSFGSTSCHDALHPTEGLPATNSSKSKKEMNSLTENEYNDFALFINFYKQRVKEFMQYLNFSNLINSGSLKNLTSMNNMNSSLLLKENSTIQDRKYSSKKSEKQWPEKVLRAFFSTKKVEVNKKMNVSEGPLRDKRVFPYGENSKRSESVYAKFKTRILNKTIFDLVKTSSTGYLKEGKVKLLQKNSTKGAIFNILNNSNYFLQSGFAPKGSLSPLLLIKNRFILLSRTGNKDFKNESLSKNLSFEKVLLDRKNEQKKRRKKKLKKETRVRKKRKRFYPRPLWMRYRLYTNFLKKRYLFVNNKENNTKRFIYEDALHRSFGAERFQNFSRNNHRNKLLISGNTLGYPINEKSNKFLLDLNANKSFYTISYSVLGDLKRVLWKSYWLRSNLNPYLTKVKNMLNEMKAYKQNQVGPLSQNVREFISALVSSDKNSDLTFNSSNFYSDQLKSTALSKWQNVLYLAEYDRITYGRLQHYLSQIRENVNVFGQNKVRLYHLGHSNSANLLRKRKKDIARQNSSDLWVKLGKTLMNLAEGDSQFSYLQSKNPFSAWWTGCFLPSAPLNLQNITVPQLRMYWALSKTNYSSFTNKDVGFYTSIGKQQIWNTTKAREQTKNNKTKKLAYQLSGKLQSFLNKQNELLKYLYNNQSKTYNNSIPTQDLESIPVNTTKKNLVLFEKSLNKIRLKEEKALYFGFRNTSFPTLGTEGEGTKINKNKTIYSTKTKASKSPLSYTWAAQLSNKSSYWWDSPLKGWANYNFVSLPYGNEGTKGKLDFSLNTKNNKNVGVFYGQSLSIETPLSLAKPFWMSSLLFHFCTLLSLLSLSQIRSLFKVYMIVFSKLFKVSKNLLTVCSDTLSTMSHFLNDSKELKTNNSFSWGSVQSNLSKKRKLNVSISNVSNEKNEDIKLSAKAQKLKKGCKASWHEVLPKENLVGTSFVKLNEKTLYKTGNFFLIEQRFYSFLESLLLKTENTALLTNSYPSEGEGKKGSSKEGTILENTQNHKNIWVYFFLRYFIQKPIFIYKKVKSSFNSNNLVNKDSQKPKALKTYTTLYSLFFLNFLFSKGYSLYSNLSSVLTQIVETIAVSAPRSVFSFFEKPGELILDWIAYMFLVEWASDIINTLPETMDSYVGSSNYKFLRTIQSVQVVTSFGLGLDLTRSLIQNSYSPINFLTNSKTLPGNSLQFENFSSVFMDNLNIGSTLIQRRVYFLYEILLFTFYQPDTDLMSRQKRGVIFWDIWGDFLTQVAEDSNINISELTSVKEEQMKLLEKCAESSNFTKNSLIAFSNSPLPTSEGSTVTQSKTGSNKRKLTNVLYRRKFKNHLTSSLLSTLFEPKLEEDASHRSEGTKCFQRPKVHESIQGAQQFLSYQGKDSELFIDLHPPKNFGIVNVLNFNESVQQPVGSLVCQIFSGLLSKQISKNILVVGSTGQHGPGGNNLLAEQKTLLVQAIAGETELKIITDNAYRYAMVYRGVAVGIKLLRDVFDSLALHTPCLFLIEDIHAIGERRPLLMSDDETTKGTASFGSQREEVHEKNQILYQLSKHVTTHYRKPYKGDFSLLIPTNHFCFDLFRGSSPSSSGGQQSKLNQSGVGGEKTLSPRILTNLANSQQATSTFDTTENNSSLKTQQSNTRLLMTKSELLSPPAYSPFSLLTLKEEKKFKAYKVVSEMPWSGYPGESLAQISKASYSIRVKVALLADMAISSLSVKLDMITDLLVIIDSVKGNRGFVVFATTHVPYILDPALRRPGRLDETITLASFPTLSSRWEILKSLFYQSASSSKGYFLGPTRGFSEQSGFNKGSTLDQSSILMTSSFTIQSFSKNLQKFISKNPKLIYTDNAFGGKQKSWLNKQKSHNLTLVHTKKSSKLFKDDSLVGLNPTLIYNKYMADNKDPFINKGDLMNLSSNSLQEGLNSLNVNLKYPYKKSNKNASLLSLATSRKIVAQTYFKSSLMISKANLFLQELFDLPFTNTTETSAFYLSFYSPQPFTENTNSSAVNASNPYGTPFDNSSNLLKKSIIQLLSGKLGEMIYFSKQSKLYLYKNNKQNTSYSPEGNLKEGTNLTKTPFLNTSGIYTSYSLNTLQSLSSLVLSFLQKRFIYHKFLSFPGFLSFSNHNPLMEASSPPLSNILLPARRYENYKRSLHFYSGNKNSLGIMEKINFHQQQRLVKRLYRYPVQEKFRSEIIENRLTGFSNASLMIGSLSDNLQKQSRSNFFIKKNILNRHRNYLTNQWWNGQLPEHNSETTFLSDIDWRYTFSESVGDLLLDFPDSEQYYNPRQRRWLLNKNAYSNYFDFDKKLYHDVYSHFIFENFNKAYKLYEKNRESLDYASFNLLRNGLHYTLNEYESFKLYKRFFKEL